MMELTRGPGGSTAELNIYTVFYLPCKHNCRTANRNEIQYACSENSLFSSVHSFPAKLAEKGPAFAE